MTLTQEERVALGRKEESESVLRVTTLSIPLHEGAFPSIFIPITREGDFYVAESTLYGYPKGSEHRLNWLSTSNLTVLQAWEKFKTGWFLQQKEDEHLLRRQSYYRTVAAPNKRKTPLNPNWKRPQINWQSYTCLKCGHVLRVHPETTQIRCHSCGSQKVKLAD